MIGATLAQYKVTAVLGEGGMGEVWRAEDSKLGREVALKVLPEGFAGDPERMARFEREARVLASLNNPDIAHLYGLETVGIDGNSRLETQDSKLTEQSGTETETGFENEDSPFIDLVVGWTADLEDSP